MSNVPKVGRRKYIQLTGSTAAISLAGCLGEDDSDTLVIGWSESGTAAYTLGQAVAATVDQNSDEISVDSRGTVPSENPRLVDNDEQDLGYTTNTGFSSAYEGEEPYDEPPLEFDPVQVMAMFSVDYFLIARSGLEIESLSDLTNHDVTLTHPGTGSYPFYRGALEGVGVYDEINESEMSFGDFPDAFAGGRIDVGPAVYIDGTQGPYNDEIVSRMDDEEYKVIGPSEEEAEQILDENPAFIIGEVTADQIYEDEDSPTVNTLSMVPMVLTGKDLDKDVVYELVRVLDENSASINEDVGAISTFGGESMLTGLNDVYPIHPGAADYYEEQGWLTDDWQVA